MGTIIYVILRLIGIVDMIYPPDIAWITLLISIDQISLLILIIYLLKRKAKEKEG
ncbi:MAG: hypothetical protein ACUVWP_04480 [bacterium]